MERAGLHRLVAGADPALLHLAVELALDQHRLVGGRPAGRRVDDDRAVHPHPDVLQHRAGPAVVHEHAGPRDHERERLRLAGGDIGERDLRRGLRGVKVNRVRDVMVGVVEGDLERVPLARPDHRSRHGAVERPRLHLHAVGDLHLLVLGDQVDGDDIGRSTLDSAPQAITRAPPSSARLNGRAIKPIESTGPSSWSTEPAFSSALACGASYAPDGNRVRLTRGR